MGLSIFPSCLVILGLVNLLLELDFYLPFKPTVFEIKRVKKLPAYFTWLDCTFVKPDFLIFEVTKQFDTQLGGTASFAVHLIKGQLLWKMVDALVSHLTDALI